MNRFAKVARIAMWVMIIAILLSFFFKGVWITITWAVAAGVCLICALLIGYNKNRNR